jgi:dTDP-D-glucose 4,6-dehydratase
LKTWLVTGGAGFIGGNFVLEALARGDTRIVNLDALTYAGNRDTLAAVADDPRHVFVHGDIGDRALVDSLLATHKPQAILNFAAESHVDRSIDGPAAFVQTNVVGTLALLESARDYWKGLDAAGRDAFRFLHVSTDEVYGSPGRDRRLHRNHALRAELAVLGQQGRLRPPGARLPPHLRAAGADHQLLEQLRPVPVPGKAHPADHPARARRRAAAGVRRRA